MSNIDVDNKENCCLISINPKIYPLDAIYSAAYVFLDKSYVLLDGDPKEKITVELRPKEKQDLEKLGREFNNELLNYAQYKKQAELNKEIRQVLLQRALLTSETSPARDTLPKEGEEEPLEELDENYLDDPEGIAIPWEEKYGKKAKAAKQKKSKKKK
ncbi:hypothetical protein KY360_00590 [Candidatus Woesearchaeota archaeon]|nr:hypothetical protein [Candidatus Woesearchaeota archaeon]